MAPVKYEGVSITLGGREFIVPALSLKRLKKMQAKLDGLGAVGPVPTPEQVDVMLEVIVLGIQRNYPEVTVEEVEDDVDLNNLMDLFAAVCGVSGLQKSAEGKV